MSRDSSGNYSLPAGNPVTTNTTISSTWANNTLNDIALALTKSVASDGQTTMTGPLAMGTNKITGLGNGTAVTDAATLGQVAAQAFVWGGTAGGTADALTLAPTPAITAYAAGQVFRFKSGASPNTAATTVAISGLTTKAIQNQGVALAGGEIEASKWYQILYDGAAFQLLNFSISAGGPFVDTYPIVVGSSDATKKVRFEVDGNTTGTTRVLTTQDKNITISDILDNHGRCQLTKSGANLLLSPFDGNTIVINSAIAIIPDAGVTLAPTTLSSNTTYYIYAYMNSGTMTLEASGTAYASQAGTGIAIKSGDATRSLVGMARIIAGPAWVDTAAQRFVRSRFNDPKIGATNFLTANVLCNGTNVELNSSARAEFLIWSGSVAQVTGTGYAQQTGGAGEAYMLIGIDGTTPEECHGGGSNYTVSAIVNTSCGFVKTGLAEGYHYATLLGTIASNNANFIGSATVGARCSIHVMC